MIPYDLSKDNNITNRDKKHHLQGPLLLTKINSNPCKDT